MFVFIVFFIDFMIINSLGKKIGKFWDRGSFRGFSHRKKLISQPKPPKSYTPFGFPSLSFLFFLFFSSHFCPFLPLLPLANKKKKRGVKFIFSLSINRISSVST